jgi:hypothetical protein
MKQRIAPWRAMVLGGLVGLNIGLAAIAASALLSSDAPALPRVDWTQQTANADPVPSDAKPIARYMQTLAHSIFFKTREPFVAPPPAPPPSPPTTRPPPPVVLDPGLILGGIVVMQGVRKAYLFVRPTRPAPGSRTVRISWDGRSRLSMPPQSCSATESAGSV